MAADKMVPVAQVKLDGTTLGENERDLILEVIVRQEQEGPDRCEIHLNNKEGRWSEDDVAAGKKLEVSFGYGSSFTKVFAGEVIGSNSSMQEKEASTWVVRGTDPLHKATRTKVVKTWQDVKDSDLASEIAGKYGLSADVDDSGFTNPYVIQNNETDLEFLNRRAHRIGFEVSSNKDGKLIFKKPEVDGSTVAKIKYDDNLKRTHFNMSTSGQPSKVKVRAWNPGEKKAFTAEAGSSDVLSTMGGGQSGPDEGGEFGDTEHSCVVDPVFSQEEIEAIAKGIINTMALNYVTLEGEAIGDPKIQARSVVELEAVGERFSGKYYVVQAIHRLYSGSSAGSGYTVEFIAKRMGSC